MDWLKNHLGSMGHAGDFYIPNPAGAGSGKSKTKIPGQEQIKIQDNNLPPRVIETDKYNFPRIQKFFEWEQFLNWVDWNGREHKRASQRTDLEFYQRTLTWSFREAMNLARYGWIDGLQQLKSIPDTEFPIKQIFQQNYNLQTRYDIAGGSVNIGRFLSAAPDCMRRISSTQNHALPSRIQKVIILCDSDKDTQPNAILKHGFTAYQIINALERANIQTEITLAYHANKDYMRNRHDYFVYETYIKIKEPTDIIYPEKLLFCLAHPSMFRRLVLSEHERNPWNIRDIFHFYPSLDHSGSYGKYLPEWLPPKPMLQDTLLIQGVLQSDTNKLIKEVETMIEQQYEHTR